MNLEKEKIVAFIVARLNSSRFPAKQLRKLGSRTLLSWTLASLQKSEEIDEIVLSTVAEDINRPLRDFSSDHNINCFWYGGNPDEVTTRLCAAAEKFEADICILISGDCPLPDGECIDLLIEQFRRAPDKDFIVMPARSSNAHCMLQGVSIARKKTWLRAEKLSVSPELKEHHFPVLHLKKEEFKPLYCQIDKPIYAPFHRLSVDTWSDYSFFIELYKKVTEHKFDFTLSSSVKILQLHPELKEINGHVHQRRIKENIPKILFIAFQSSSVKVDTVLLPWTNIELALNIVESKGWPVEFATNDRSLRAELYLKGIRHSIFPNTEQIFGSLQPYGSTYSIILDNVSRQFSEENIENLLSSCSSLIILEEDKTQSQGNPLRLDVAKYRQSDNAIERLTTAITSHITSFCP